MKGRIWIWNILALICLTACDRWFDVNPQTEVKQKELFSTDQGFYNALMGVYLNLSDPELNGGVTVRISRCVGTDLFDFEYDGRRIGLFVCGQL